jgi:hypothetical protein
MDGPVMSGGLARCLWLVTLDPQPDALAVDPEETGIDVPYSVQLWAQQWDGARLLVSTERDYCGMTGRFEAMEGFLTPDEAAVVYAEVCVKASS